MLVQAKALNDKETAYDHIARTIGNTGKRQIDQLIETAERRGIPAAYAFYNHLSEPPSALMNCQSLDSAALQIASWGISIADAQDVSDLLPDQSFDTISQVSHPLHCLLCSGGAATFGPGGSPAAIARRMQGELVKGFDEDAPRWKPKTELPEYFHLLRRALAFPGGDLPQRVIDPEVREKLAAANPDIDGLVVIQDSGAEGRAD